MVCAESLLLNSIEKYTFMQFERSVCLGRLRYLLNIFQVTVYGTPRS
jgi:hypothetical protein